ncbi:hypothetical protein PRK78_003747 [Emydomyces testavorans]|uniref:Uncharacterized protein n=1 Tax=Emydomyces testavorans TaxID=2070801 RepID=A0AAF0DHG0_9EURO|nr:hypothetical protein PRK78_003747 [Emydomyces testavorans]
MATAPQAIAKPPQTTERLITTVHSNSVVSDAAKPVKIDHYADGAVVGPLGENQHIGVIHFPLPLVLDAKQEKDRPGLSSVIGRMGSLDVLEVDFTQVSGGGAHLGGGLSQIVKAEIHVGCKKYWCTDLDKDTSFSVRVEKPLSQFSLDQPKGINVSLTIMFGGNKLRFCSTTVFGSALTMPGGGIIKPGEE